MAKKRKAKESEIKEIQSILHKNEKKHGVAVFYIIATIALIALTFIWMQPVQKEQVQTGITDCTTRECFLQKANGCEKTSFVTKIETATIQLEIRDGCTLYKKIVALDPEEPQEMLDVFLDAEMECLYTNGLFDEDYVSQISGPLENCAGTLVDSINAII